MNKVSKKILMTSAIAVILNTTMFAGENVETNNYKSILYSPTAENYGVELNQIKYKAINLRTKTMKMSHYMDIAVGAEGDFQNFLINMGPTFTLTKNIAVYGGIGASYFRAGKDVDSSMDGKFDINFNAGAIVTIYDKVGLLAEYDTATKAAGFGLAYKF